MIINSSRDFIDKTWNRLQKIKHHETKIRRGEYRRFTDTLVGIWKKNKTGKRYKAYINGKKIGEYKTIRAAKGACVSAVLGYQNKIPYRVITVNKLDVEKHTYYSNYNAAKRRAKKKNGILETKCGSDWIPYEINL